MGKKRVPRSVYITGASSGIGRALALELAGRGAEVVVSARREAELAELVSNIEKAGGRAHALVCDVADPHAAAAAVRRADELMGSLDMVVANAGIGHASHATRLGVDEIVRMVDINIRGAMATLVAAIPVMLAHQRGHLVGVSSLAGRRAIPASGAYSASKAALSTFLETLRLDLTRTRIVVTDVQPGFVETPILEGARNPTPFKWPVARATRYIADGLAKEKRIVSFPLPLDLLTRLSRVLPAGIYARAVGGFREG
jgi:NADP-dependent 3-hydroxy acid dehydrogenase YdfG